MKVFKDSYVVAIAINGKSLTSEGLADFITQTTLKGVSHITFVIGGSYGLSNNIKNRSNYKLSFSNMTFPHGLFRLIFLEQLYKVTLRNNICNYMVKELDKTNVPAVNAQKSDFSMYIEEMLNEYF